MKKVLLIFLIISIISISITSIYAQSQYDIPSWVKGIAGFWAEGKISDSEFEKGLSFLIDSGIIKVPLIQELQNEIDELKIENKNLKSILDPALSENSSIVNDSYKSIPKWIIVKTNIDSDKIDLIFNLIDDSGTSPNDGRSISVNGLAEIRIINSDKDIVYEKIINAKKDDFGWDKTIDSETFELLNKIEIPIEDIKPSKSTTGMLFFKFSSNGDTFETTQELTSLPIIDYEELSLQLYHENSITHTRITKNPDYSTLDIEVNEFGIFKIFDSDGNEIPSIRIDMTIINSGKKDVFTFDPNRFMIQNCDSLNPIYDCPVKVAQLAYSSFGDNRTISPREKISGFILISYVELDSYPTISFNVNNDKRSSDRVGFWFSICNNWGPGYCYG